LFWWSGVVKDTKYIQAKWHFILAKIHQLKSVRVRLIDMPSDQSQLALPLFVI